MPFDDLDMSLGDPELDCVTTLAFFAPEARRRLLAALREGRLIRHKYQGDDCSRGCVMHMLDEKIVSKPTLLSYPFATEEVRLAARRLVRYWDGGVLTESMLERILLPMAGVPLPQERIEVSALYHDFKFRQLRGHEQDRNIDLRFDTLMHDLGLPRRDAHDALNDAVMAGLAFVKLRHLVGFSPA